MARALTGIGQIERDLHRGEIALRHYEEAAAIYRAQGDVLKLAHTVRHVSDIQQDLGRPYLAEPHYNEALALYRGDQSTGPLDLANAIRGLAILKQNAGEVERAKALWDEAKDLYTTSNVEDGVTEAMKRLALLAQS